MAAVGGRPVDCTINGRIYALMADATMNVKEGGDSNTASPTAGGDSSLLKDFMSSGVEGMAVQIDDTTDDFTFLQQTANLTDYFTFLITWASGAILQGRAQINELVEEKATARATFNLVGASPFTTQ